MAETIQTTADEFIDFVKQNVVEVPPFPNRKSMVIGVGSCAIVGARGILPIDEARFSVRSSVYQDGGDVHIVKLCYQGETEREITHNPEEGFIVWWNADRYMTDEAAEGYAALVLGELENLADDGKLVPHPAPVAGGGETPSGF